MYFNKNHSAQGTIEYLVILAVIVVIALIVVGLFTGIFSSPSQQILSSSSKTGEVAVGGISIVESVVDSEGDSLIFLSNNSNDSITLKKVSVGGVDNNFDNQIVGLDSKGFSLSGLSSACPCVSGQKSVKCEFRIEYLTATGITKTESRIVNVECVTDSKPTDENKIIPPVILETGTLEHPWRINTCTKLQNMRDHLDGNYILIKDIDCSETSTWNLSGETYLGFEPVGSPQTRFIGTFNGQGYSISRLYINRTSYAALFGHTNGANISNVNLIDLNMIGSEYFTAGLVGVNDNSVLDNISLSGFVVGNWHVGALAGQSNFGSVITNSSSTVRVSGDSYVGGLVGWNTSGSSIIDSYNNGPVLGVGGVGGITGETTENSLIQRCYNLNDVNGTNAVGGITGNLTDSSVVLQSYNSGQINSTANYVGGIVGGIQNSVMDSVYNTAHINGVNYVGGIFGYGANASMTNLYNLGDVVGTGVSVVGGIGGQAIGSSSLINSYNFASITGVNSVGGILGDSEGTSYIKNSFTNSDIIGGEPSVGLIAGASFGGELENVYAYVPEGALACCGFDSCTCTKETTLSNFYSSGHTVYTSSPVWDDGNWVWSGNGLPTLAWQ